MTLEQPVDDPDDPGAYLALLLDRRLIDLRGEPLVVEPCTHGPDCGTAYHVTNITDPLSIACPTCGNPPGQACRIPRPSTRVTFPGRLHAARDRAARAVMDERAAAGDLTVPAPWPSYIGRHRVDAAQAAGEDLGPDTTVGRPCVPWQPHRNDGRWTQ